MNFREPVLICNLALHDKSGKIRFITSERNTLNLYKKQFSFLSHVPVVCMVSTLLHVRPPSIEPTLIEYKLHVLQYARGYGVLEC